MKRLKFLILLCIMTFAVSCGQQKKYIEYKVKDGETMRSIAKNYNLKTKDLLRLNPDVGRKPDANTVIIIPNSKNNNTQIAENIKVEETKIDEIKTPIDVTSEDTNTIDPELEELKKSFVIHKVKAKETVYGLTRFYNISKEELFTLNPSVEKEGLKINQIIKIKPILTEEDALANDVFEDNINSNTEVNIALLLPFKANEYKDTNSKDIFSKNTLANIVTDFYMGAEIAIDSIKKQGVKVNVQVFDTENRNSKINSIASNNQLKNADVIIGPFYSDEAKKLASKVNSPVVFPHFSKDQKTFSSSKLIKTAPDKSIYLETLTTYLSESYTNENIIVVGDGKATSNSNILKIVTKLKKNDSIKAISILKPKDGYIKKEKFTDLMKPKTHTWVIVISDNDVAVADALNSMISLPEEVTTQVFAIEKNKAFNRIDNFKLAKINFSYVTNEFIDESNFATKIFNSKYRKLNNSLPSNYATKGFDITYDVLARLASSDNDLKETLNQGSSYRLVSKFDYKKRLFGVTNNEGLFILKYNKDLSLTRLR
ncbi:PBP1 and LysM peptidoglycan-binding domain-containing protein [Tenacibaculum aquimarinum]|uniref:PBP1 and LysM peptidoglycan-binding domain-containing protein n=1 Tax=Tenacibaculum aquimarinum TaxID=2910675 RepID=UPI001F0B0F9E|nr:LysM peptidoglycan-binding domain-containing protein [Tenacibaculum aquimarinum]MCH3884626.1 LysM peptidoglycan-binding domain-containing protein [Tenacibaculum aquimarinum]